MEDPRSAPCRETDDKFDGEAVHGAEDRMLLKVDGALLATEVHQESREDFRKRQREELIALARVLSDCTGRGREGVRAFMLP